ncbi:MAG: tetratricopeptide repeat protein [Phycisphaerales bacterium]|nr:MAG: tetratricopeptide repeat protein [Phycisphaerales bacterium]
MPKGGYKAILVRWSVVVLISSAVPGCSVRPEALQAYLDSTRLRDQGQNDLAIEKLKQALEADQAFALAYSGLGRAYLGTGDFAEAEAAFRRATVLDPWSLPDHVDLARVRQMRERFADAAQAYARAAELAPESAEIQLEAAACCLQAGVPARALAHVESAIQIKGRSPEVLRLLGKLHEARGDYEQALAVYREWSESTPDMPDGMLAMALAQSRNGEYDEARQVLVAVLRKWPGEAAAFRHLAYCLLKLGDTDGAIEMYENAIARDADSWQAHRGLGVAYMVKARQTRDDRFQGMALQHWRWALSLDPDQPRHDVLQRLIREHSTTGNPLQGLEY